MGTGKTVVGKAVARKLGMQFLDLDDLIEEKEGMKITDVFARKGEPYFRDVESRVLREVSERQSCVSACGGGIVLRDKNIIVMENTGNVLCFDACPEVIYERTKKFTHRPLLNVDHPLLKIRELLGKRTPFYAKIKNHLDTSGLTVEEQVAETLRILRELEK